MKVGDLVTARLHTNKVMLGIVGDIFQPTDTLRDHIDSMFPYFVCFNDASFNDWYQLATLEVISESR